MERRKNGDPARSCIGDEAYAPAARSIRPSRTSSASRQPWTASTTARRSGRSLLAVHLDTAYVLSSMPVEPHQIRALLIGCVDLDEGAHGPAVVVDGHEQKVALGCPRQRERFIHTHRRGAAALARGAPRK